jgi:hypothetical protein
LRTRLRTPISIVAKYSLRVSIAPKKIIKAQWSSVGTVRQSWRGVLTVFLLKISYAAEPGPCQAYIAKANNLIETYTHTHTFTHTKRHTHTQTLANPNHASA